MNCPYCGVSLKDAKAAVCPRCGLPLTDSPARAQGDEQPPLEPTYPQVYGSQQGQARTATSSTSQWMKPALAPAQPAPKRSRRRRNLISGIVLICLVAACAGYAYLTFFVNGSAPAAGATPTSSSNVLFFDPLTSNSNGWTNNAHCFFQDNAYHVKTNILCYAPTANVSDGAITVQAKQIAGSSLQPYGIAFRGSISNYNWYEFDIDSNGQWAFLKSVNQTHSIIVDFTPNAAIKTGLNTTNTLLVQAKGAHFTFFVNGTKVGEADDTTYTNGLSGLLAGGPDTEVAYTNFEITRVS